MWRHISFVIDKRTFDCKFKCSGIKLCLWIMHMCVCLYICIFFPPCVKQFKNPGIQEGWLGVESCQMSSVIKRVWEKIKTEPQASTTSKVMFKIWGAHSALFYLIAAYFLLPVGICIGFAYMWFSLQHKKMTV